MQKFIIFLTLFHLTFYSFAQKQENPFRFTPPGTVYLYDSLFIDETEVSNLAYLEFLYFLNKDSTEELYVSQLPINEYTSYNYIPIKSLDSANHQYLHGRDYRYYPVLGVSYEEAVSFCSWRSDFVNKMLNDKEFRRQLLISRKYDLKFHYRLPTKKEWEYAAAGGLKPKSFPYGIIRPRLMDERFSFKIKDDPDSWVSRCLDTLGIPYDENEIIHKVEFNVKEDFNFGLDELIDCGIIKYTGLYEYPTNAYGIHNMIGNAAEMTLTKGIAKGGSFIHSLEDFNLMTVFTYEERTNWLGFRCICEVEIIDK